MNLLVDIEPTCAAGSSEPARGIKFLGDGDWMCCLKVFGERIAARDPDRQTAEVRIRAALINRFNALGSVEIVRVA